MFIGSKCICISDKFYWNILTIFLVFMAFYMFLNYVSTSAASSRIGIFMNMINIPASKPSRCFCTFHAMFHIETLFHVTPLLSNKHHPAQILSVTLWLLCAS